MFSVSIEVTTDKFVSMIDAVAEVMILVSSSSSVSVS